MSKLTIVPLNIGKNRFLLFNTYKFIVFFFAETLLIHPLSKFAVRK